MADQQQNHQQILQDPPTQEQILRWRRLLFRRQAIRAAKNWVRALSNRRGTLYIDAWIFRQLVDLVEENWFEYEPELEQVPTDGLPYLPSEL